MIIDYVMISKLTGSPNDETLSFLVDSIIEKVENIIGYKLKEESVVHNIEGVDKNILYLRKRPIKSVEQVKLYDGVINHNFLPDKNYVMLDIPVCCGELAEVSYTAGYDELPKSLTMLIAELLKMEIMSLQMAGVKSYKIKDISYSFIDGLQNDQVFMEKIQSIFKVY